MDEVNLSPFIVFAELFIRCVFYGGYRAQTSTATRTHEVWCEDGGVGKEGD